MRTAKATRDNPDERERCRKTVQKDPQSDQDERERTLVVEDRRFHWVAINNRNRRICALRKSRVICKEGSDSTISPKQDGYM